jgi:hypothetical protein
VLRVAESVGQKPESPAITGFVGTGNVCSTTGDDSERQPLAEVNSTV